MRDLRTSSKPKLLALFAAGVFAASLALPTFSLAIETFTIAIKAHRFEPPDLEVPAGIKFRLIVDNQDPTPEEFESYELNREKIISGSSKGTVFIGPLAPGVYPYFGEFNMDTAQGRLIAK